MDLASLELSSDEEGMNLPLHIQPGAPRDGVVGIHEGALKLRISARPIGGAANERCLKFLAKGVLEVSKSRLTLISGLHARRKVVRIEGMTDAQVRSRLEAALPDGS